MLRFLSLFITVPLTVLVVDFAVSNRQAVAINLFPLPNALEMPLFLPVTVAAAAGVFIGAFIAWVAGHRARARARTEKKRADKLQAQLTEARTTALLKPEPLPAIEALPPLPY